MPVPGSQVVGFRPLLGHEERLARQELERAPADDRWSPTASAIFIVAASTGLWVAIGLAISAFI